MLRDSTPPGPLLLQVGMSQMSAGSKTDVGAYHRDDSEATEKNLSNLAGQFSLMDHRWGVRGGARLRPAGPVMAPHRTHVLSRAWPPNLTKTCCCLPTCRGTPDIVKDLMLNGYVPSWCTACYRKGRTGEHFMKIAKAGNIHSFCHPNSILTLQVSSSLGVAVHAPNWYPSSECAHCSVPAHPCTCGFWVLEQLLKGARLTCAGVPEGLWHR